MQRTGYIEIIISGKKGDIAFMPENYDIRDIIADIQQVENLLFPGEKTNRPIISYKIDKGSVKHLFTTSLQSIIAITAILGEVIALNSIDFMEPNTAKAIEYFQDYAIKKDLTINITTSQPDSPNIVIEKNTHYYRTDNAWVDVEFYFYGKITNAGGKDKANIHLLVPELGTIIIRTPQSILEKFEDNILYKQYGIRASGKQNIQNGELDKSSLVYLDLIDYNAKYDNEYLKMQRKKAMKWLRNINPEQWLTEVRGGSYE